MTSTAKFKSPIVQSFRPNFCSPGFLNGLLRLQHLHWLEIRRRLLSGPGGEGVVSSFLFVIPANQLNLACVLATEVPRLESELGCQLRQVPVPEFVAPDGLKAFNVDYAKEPAAHTKFLATLKSICVRLQLTRICVDPVVGNGSGGCAACTRVRTHTKTVRGTSTARTRLRLPQLTLDLTRQRTRRPASAETTISSHRDLNANKNLAVPSPIQTAAPKKYATVENMAETAVQLLYDRLLLSEAATDESALTVTAASGVLGIFAGTGSLQRPEWHQFYCLDLHVASVVADAIAIREHICDQVADVFAEWGAELSNRLLVGCQRLMSDAVTTSAVAAFWITNRAAGLIIGGMVYEVATEMATAERTVVRVSLPCDWRTRRSLLSLRPVLRRCPGCSACIFAEAAGPSGFRLSIKSRGQRCTKHVSLLKLANCARSSKDASLGGLLLQDVAALPVWGD